MKLKTEAKVAATSAAFVVGDHAKTAFASLRYQSSLRRAGFLLGMLLVLVCAVLMATHNDPQGIGVAGLFLGWSAGTPAMTTVFQSLLGVYPVKGYGAVGDGVTDDRPALAAAVLAAEARGNAVVTFAGGTYLMDSGAPISLTPGRTGTGWLVLDGYGATIKIGPNMSASNRGFLTSGRTADDQTLARIIVEGFEIDGQKLTAASSEGLRGGNIFRAAGSTLAQRLNYEDIIFRDIYSHGIAKPSTYTNGGYAGTGDTTSTSTSVANATGTWYVGQGITGTGIPAGTTVTAVSGTTLTLSAAATATATGVTITGGTFNNQTHLYMAVYHANQSGAVNTIKRIRVENVRMESGVHGVFIGANVGSGTGATVYYDDIKIADSLMDHLEAHTTETGSCFQVGSHAYGDRCAIERTEGRYSNDTAFEVNACQQLSYRDCVSRDHKNVGFYARDFATPQDALSKQWTIQGCKAVVENVIPTNGLTVSHGIQIGALSTDIFGLVVIRDYVYRNTTAMKYDGDSGNSSSTQQGHGIYLIGSEVQTLRIENAVIRETGIALDTTTKGGTFSPVSIRPRSATTKMRLVIDGLHVKQAGTIVSIPNAWTYFGLIVQSDPTGSGTDISVDIRDLDVDFQIPSNGSYAWGMVALGTVSGITTTLRGVLRRLFINSGVATTGSSLGVRVGATDRCTIDKVLRLEACNFAGLGTSNNEVTISGSGSNMPSIVLRDCTLRSASTLNGAAPIAITPGGSPYTYQNLDGVREEVRITSGTVSDISHSRDNSTFGTIAAATGERVSLEPGHAVKVTYTVAPTMTKTLQR